jgi:hypothetical protein
MKLMSMKIWVWCPHCMAGHQIRPSEALLQEEQEQDVLTAVGDGIALR